MISNNVSNYEFNKQVNMSHLWNKDDVFDSESKWSIVHNIQANNKNMVVTQLNKQSPEINMLPYFINEPKVEYFPSYRHEPRQNYIILHYSNRYECVLK